MPPASSGSNLDSEEFARWWSETGERELRQLLFWRWDPIGVSDAFPNTADEYDDYAPQIVSALRTGASEHDIDALLATFECDAIGLTPRSRDGVRPVVPLLFHWIENSQDSWRAFGPMHR